ncbi:hypothetical protein DICPUDRAFT_84703, partial [Dictyostelium purpureum]
MNNSSNNNSMDSIIDNNNQIKNEILFWKVFHNKYLFFFIFSKLKNRECFTKTYKEIYKVGEILKNGSISSSSSSSSFLELLLDKVLNEQYLVFENVSVIKQLLQNPFFKNNEPFFTKLRDYYKLNQILVDSKDNLPIGQLPIGIHELDIVYLSIISCNVSSLKVFYNSSSSVSNKNQLLYIGEAIKYQNLETLDFVYKAAIQSNNNTNEINEYVQNLPYLLFFDQPNTEIIRYAIKQMNIKFSPSKIPLLTFFKVDIELVKELMGTDAASQVIQIEQPISTFQLFYYDWFQGTIKDLIHHSMALQLIEKIYRNQIQTTPAIPSLFEELNNYVNRAKDIQNSSLKLYDLSNDELVFKLLKVYIEILLTKYMDLDYFFHNDGKKKSPLYYLVEYSVRFNNINILDTIINPPKQQSDQSNDNNNNSNNNISIYSVIIEKSIEYCNEQLFNIAINRLSLKRKFSFNIKSNGIFKKLLNNSSSTNNINSIKSFIDNCIINNIEKIDISSFYTILLQLDNWEIIEYFYNNRGKISYIHCSVLKYVESPETLERILNQQREKFYSTWEIKELFNRDRLDLLNIIEKYTKEQNKNVNNNNNNKGIIENLKTIKNNQDFANEKIKGNNTNFKLIDYLIENGYNIPYDTVLLDMADEIKSSENLSKNLLKKFKYLLDLNDLHPTRPQFKYGAGFSAAMVYPSNLEIILFIKDYRPWELVRNNDEPPKFKYYNPASTNFFYYLSGNPTQNIIKLFLKTGRYNLLLDYLKFKKDSINAGNNDDMDDEQFSNNIIVKLLDSERPDKLTIPYKIFKEYLLYEKNHYFQSPQSPDQIRLKNYLENLLKESVKNANLSVIKLLFKLYPTYFNYSSVDEFFQNNRHFFLKNMILTDELVCLGKLLNKLFPIPISEVTTLCTGDPGYDYLNYGFSIKTTCIVDLNSLKIASHEKNSIIITYDDLKCFEIGLYEIHLSNLYLDIDALGTTDDKRVATKIYLDDCTFKDQRISSIGNSIPTATEHLSIAVTDTSNLLFIPFSSLKYLKIFILAYKNIEQYFPKIENDLSTSDETNFYNV